MMSQDRSEDDFIIVQDVDVTQDDWTLWRNSLAQMFIAMREEESRLPLIEDASICRSLVFLSLFAEVA